MTYLTVGGFPQNVMYTIDSMSKKCNVSTPHHHFIPIGVPPDAKFVAEAILGASGVQGEHLDVASFEADFDDGKRFISKPLVFFLLVFLFLLVPFII